MSDIPYIQQAQEVKITGQDSAGSTVNYVGADVNGNLKTIDYSTGATGAAVPADASLLGAKDGANIQAITSSSNGNAGNELLHTQTPDTTSATTALGALNAVITIAMAGCQSSGFQLNAGTLIGTITPQCSLDGGITYVNCSFYDPVNSTVSSNVVFASSNGLKVLSILPIGGSSHVQVKVTAYTSGTANSTLRASQVTGATGAITAAAYSTVANSYIAIPGNTATLLMAANPNRKYLYISNNSGSTMQIQLGSSTGLTATSGLVVPSKGVYELKGDNLYTGAIYGFAAGNITISVTEGIP